MEQDDGVIISFFSTVFVLAVIFLGLLYFSQRDENIRDDFCKSKGFYEATDYGYYQDWIVCSNISETFDNGILHLVKREK